MDVAAHIEEVGESEGLLRIAQGYLDGRLTIHLHLRVRSRGLDSDPHEFCAVVASNRGNVGDAEDLSYVFDRDRIPREEARIRAFAAVGNGDRGGSRESAADWTNRCLSTLFSHVSRDRYDFDARSPC